MSLTPLHPSSCPTLVEDHVRNEQPTTHAQQQTGGAEQPTRVVMVGDGDIDIEAGRRAGVITCGVTYGLGNKEDLVGAGPDFLIDDLSELADHFC